MVYRESSAKWIVLFVLVIVIVAVSIGLTLYISELNRKLDSEHLQSGNLEQQLANLEARVAALKAENASLNDQKQVWQRQRQTDIGTIQSLSQSLTQLQSQLLVDSAAVAPPQPMSQVPTNATLDAASIAVVNQPALIAISAVCLALIGFNFKVALQVRQERDHWMAESQVLCARLGEQAEKISLIRHHYQAVIHAERQRRQL